MQGWFWLKVRLDLDKHQDVTRGACKSCKHLQFLNLFTANSIAKEPKILPARVEINRETNWREC